MSDTTLSRLTRIERELRFWRLGSFTVLVGLLLLSATPKTLPSESIATKELLLVDDAGRLRGRLGLSSDGPGLSFAGTDGHVNIIVSGSDETPGFSISHGDRFVAGMFEAEGLPRLTLADNKDAESLTLRVDNRGPLLGMFGSASKAARLSASVYDNAPQFALKDAQGQISALVGSVGNTAMIALPGLDPKTDAGVSIIRDGSKAYVEVDHARGGFAQLGTVGFADRENNPIESPFPVLAIFNANGDTIFNSTALTDIIKGFEKKK